MKIGLRFQNIYFKYFLKDIVIYNTFVILSISFSKTCEEFFNLHSLKSFNYLIQNNPLNTQFKIIPQFDSECIRMYKCKRQKQLFFCKFWQVDLQD